MGTIQREACFTRTVPFLFYRDGIIGKKCVFFEKSIGGFGKA